MSIVRITLATLVSILGAPLPDLPSFASPPRLCMPDSASAPSRVILHIAPLNGDCRLDTVQGHMDSRFQYVPDRILWGGWDHLHAPPCPITPDHPEQIYPRLPSTTIQFPPFPGLSASISFDNVNQDQNPDIVIHYWWPVGEAPQHDSGRTVVIFAQSGLDSIPVIDIGAIGVFQAAPYFAMELRPGIEMVDPAVRDPSGMTSSILLPVTIKLPPPQKQEQTAAVTDPWRVQVSPNPAHVAAEITGHLIPPGDYTVEVVNVNGSLEQRHDVSVTETGELFRIIDLHDLASGYYVVRLHTGDKLFGTYPIIITR